MLERAQEVTRHGPSTDLAEARCAEALVIVGDASPQHAWLLKAVETRLREALAALQVAINAEKSRGVARAQGEPCSFLGFDCRRVRSRRGVWRAWYPPRRQQRTSLLRKLQELCRRYQSQPLERVMALRKPIVRGGVRSCAGGEASRGFGVVKDWVEKKGRRHLMRARKRRACPRPYLNGGRSKRAVTQRALSLPNPASNRA